MFYLCDSYGSQVDQFIQSTKEAVGTTVKGQTVNCQREVIVSITIVDRQSPSWIN